MWPRVTRLAIAVFFLATLPAAAAPQIIKDDYAGRSMIIVVPSHLPPPGQRALVVVLHPGLSSAEHIQDMGSRHGLYMNLEAERYGFIAVYLNGTPVTRLSSKLLGWNAGGGCCGLSASRNVDDFNYVQGAVAYVAKAYGIDTQRIFGLGHSNGAMLTQLLVCQTNLFAAAVAVSGPLNVDVASCPAARGKRILAIHGVQDRNVPFAGGKGSEGLSGATYHSEDYAKSVFIRSGATYDLLLLDGADHKIMDIDAAVRRTYGLSIAEEAARFFGLNKD